MKALFNLLLKQAAEDVILLLTANCTNEPAARFDDTILTERWNSSVKNINELIKKGGK